MPNASRKYWMMFVNSSTSWVASCVSWTPVCTCVLGGRIGSISCDELLGAHTLTGGDRDAVEHALLVEQLLSPREREDGERRAAERLLPGELGQTGDRERLHGPLGHHADLIADREPFVLGGRGVDDDLVRAVRPRALRELGRVEALILRVLPEGERRRSAGFDDVAVLRRQLREVVDATFCGSDAGKGPDLVEQALGEGRRQPEVGLEGLLARDDGVGPRVHGREDVVERLVDRVREDVGAADHRDAEHDRESREDRAQLPAREALESDLDHRPTSSFIAVSTSAAVERPRSLTMRPSARKRMRSAMAAARASCVTIRVVWP